MKDLIIIILLTFLILLFAVLSIGGGHGIYWPTKIIYPYSMIISIINNQIGTLAIILAVIQVPIYGFVINKKTKLFFLILVIHIVTAIICFNLPSETFYD